MFMFRPSQCVRNDETSLVKASGHLKHTSEGRLLGFIVQVTKVTD